MEKVLIIEKDEELSSAIAEVFIEEAAISIK